MANEMAPFYFAYKLRAEIRTKSHYNVSYSYKVVLFFQRWLFMMSYVRLFGKDGCVT